MIVYTPALENGYTSETKIPNINIDAAKQKGVDVKSLSGERLVLRNAVERSKMVWHGISMMISHRMSAWHI